MLNSNKSRLIIFIGIAIFTFAVWFGDGYLQWVNSDTAADTVGAAQQINFPQGLVSSHDYHARFTGVILSYIPFNTVGFLFRELSNDPVTALYFSQGVMTGSIFLMLILISAAYVSISTSILSSRYLISTFILTLFVMSMPAFTKKVPISLILRFGHQSLMSHYIGTMTIVLFALYPYWRYIFSGNWDDWYNDSKCRSIFYVLVIAAVFSTTGMMIWLCTFSTTALLSIIYYTAIEKKGLKNVADIIKNIIKNSIAHPLIVILILFIIGIVAESTTSRGSSSFVKTDFLEYVKVYTHFLISRSMIVYSISCLVFIAFIIYEYKKRTVSKKLLLLAKIFPWLFIGNLVFIFVIGLPRVPYRFMGYNLGPDIVFPATWSMTLWLITVVLEYWRENKLVWFSPILIFVLITNSLTFFNFPSSWYERRELQKSILSFIHRENINLPMDVILPIPVRIAFSKSELQQYTIPMLRKFGIISYRRRIIIVSYKVYKKWHAARLKKQIPSLTLLDQYRDEYNIDFSKSSYPDYLIRVSGLSQREDWGRWTDANMGSIAKIKFKGLLPEKFTLELKASAFGPNIGIPIKIRVGSIEKKFTLPDEKEKILSLDFKGVKNTDTIEIIPPKPASPYEIDSINQDRRKLGLKLFYLKILR
jgi:hypothetical protein